MSVQVHKVRLSVERPEIERAMMTFFSVENGAHHLRLSKLMRKNCIDGCVNDIDFIMFGDIDDCAVLAWLADSDHTRTSMDICVRKENEWKTDYSCFSTNLSPLCESRQHSLPKFLGSKKSILSL